MWESLISLLKGAFIHQKEQGRKWELKFKTDWSSFLFTASLGWKAPLFLCGSAAGLEGMWDHCGQLDAKGRRRSWQFSRWLLLFQWSFRSVHVHMLVLTSLNRQLMWDLIIYCTSSKGLGLTWADKLILTSGFFHLRSYCFAVINASPI